MSTKVKRKVTVENSKDNPEHPRRPSVFERLGPGAVTIPSQSQDRHSRIEHNEKCRNWLRTGNCAYGNTCRYQHDTFPSSTRRSSKAEKEIDEKDLRHKVRNKREEPKESRTGSVSPKRKGSKRSGSRSRKGDHESKIKSTVVVTRPRSPTTTTTEPTEKEKKKPEGSWEDDSDDWPMDAAQLDYKEELTLERKRQQLQRELELELQKERLLNENVTITKTVSFSESSSSSSSSDSCSISSSSDSSSSSSDDDSDDSSSSSSSSSSSESLAPVKKYKKPMTKKEPIPEKNESSAYHKPRDNYDKIKSSRAAKSSGGRTRSSVSPDISSKKGRDRRNISPPTPSPKRRVTHEPSGSSAKGSSNIRARGPRTPSPSPVSRKHRQWNQSSSADSHSADHRRNRNKRHKKKKDAPRSDRMKSDYIPVPPPLSSPNRTALLPHLGKKSRQRADETKSRRRNRDQSPLLLSRISGPTNTPSVRLLGSNQHYASDQDKHLDKQGQLSDRSKGYNRKSGDARSLSRRVGSRDRTVKRSRLSPAKDTRHDSLSPIRDKYETELLTSAPRKVYNSPIRYVDKDDKNNRRRRSPSPPKSGKEIRDRRKVISEIDKKRDVRESSPRNIDNRRDNQYRNTDPHGYQKKDNEPRIKRVISPEMKKGRDDKPRDRGQKDRNCEHDAAPWSDEQKKSSSLSGSRIVESRGRQEPPMQPPPSRNDRSRDRERDRKKGKEREPPIRTVEEVDRDRQRLPSPGRGPSDMHHPIREVEPSLPISRRRMYEPEMPPGERDYAYGYGSHRDTLYDRLLPPDYEQDLRGPMYPPSGYPETEYRRDATMKDPGPLPHIERIGGYGGREVLSPRDILPPHDVLGIPVRDDDYLADIPIDERHAFEERWGRSRPMRDDWDPYAPLPPAPLPVHVTAGLDEDRYGMPRRRRASPDWPMPRGEDRELSIREPRSRSPPHRRVADAPPPNRPSWPEHQDRHGNRNGDSRFEMQQKNHDDRKGRNIRDRRDRRDRGKRCDEPPNDLKPLAAKEKLGGKRPHSPSPPRKDIKKRKEDDLMLDMSIVTDKTVISKKAREELKSDSKPPLINRLAKTIKNEIALPKVDVTTNSRVPVAEKVETPPKIASAGNKVIIKQDREEKRMRRNNDDKMHGDEFSDWSDGDDDLLNRDDFIDNEANNGGERGRIRADENKDRRERNIQEVSLKIDEANKQAKDHVRDMRQKPKDPVLQSRNRTESKERTSEETLNANKEGGPPSTTKDAEPMESYVIKDETATDVDDYITTESVDYDPISDDELEALIEEPDESVLKPLETTEKSKIVDALDVNWSTLMSETKSEFVPGFARRRFKTAHVLSRIGFSKTLAGSEVAGEILRYCQAQLDEEKVDENKVPIDSKRDEQKFVMEHNIAAFHVAISERKKERRDIFNQVGPFRRALCARRDLQIRKLLCRSTDKLVATLPTTYTQQYNNVDKELYKQSVELLKLKRNECQPHVINAC